MKSYALGAIRTILDGRSTVLIANRSPPTPHRTLLIANRSPPTPNRTLLIAIRALLIAILELLIANGTLTSSL